MVLKFCKGDFYTGNTIRKKLFDEYKRKHRTKGIRISNLKYYTGAPSFEHIISKLDDQADKYLSSEINDYTYLKVLEIKHLIEYFCERNAEISDGLFDRDYVNTSYEDYINELEGAIQQLSSYQSEINSGELYLGLGEDEVSISLTIYEHGDLTDIGRKHYAFDTYRSAVLEEEERKRRIAAVQRRWHNIGRLRGIQRPANLIHHYKHQDDDMFRVYPNKYEIAITLVKNEEPATSSKIQKLLLDSQLRPKNHKSFKKSHHQKVKQYSYHNDFDRKEVASVVQSILSARASHRRRKQEQRKQAEFRIRRAGKIPPWIPSPSAYHIPVGLWPDDAAIIKRKRERQIQTIQDVKDKNNLKQKVKKQKKQKPSDSINITSGDTFLTRVAYADEAFISRLDKQKEESIAAIDFKPEVKRITLYLDIWEFVDDLINHVKEDQKIVLTNCQLLEKRTCIPHPPQLAKEVARKQSLNSVAQDSVIDVSTVKCDKDKVTKEKESFEKVSSQRNDQIKMKKGNQNITCGSSIKTNVQSKKRKNGRKRKKEKLQCISQQEQKEYIEQPLKIQRQETKVSIKGEPRQETKLSMKSQESSVVITAVPKMVHTKDNTQLFLDNFSDFRFQGIELKIKSSSLKPSYLTKKFGNNYQEASLFPRVFCVDLTDKLMDVFTLFRKPEEPFCKPFATLVVQLHHSNGAEIAKENSLAFTMAKLFLKADMEILCFEDFHNKMKDKLKYHLIYPISKIVDDMVQVYKILPYTSYAMPKIIPDPSLKAAERVRSQLDWLYTLCQWKFDIYSAMEAYTKFSQSFQAFNIPRPTTSSLCRIIDSTPNIALRSCDIPTCYHTPYMQFLSCQHAMCKRCLQQCIIEDMCKKHVPLCCWIPGCKTVIDPVSLQFLLSLPLYKLQQAYMEDSRIASHPLWQWCPRTGCGRVIKLSGAGFLDNGVVIVCDCGEVWCFHCRQEGHWPASCSQAKSYAQLREQDAVEPHQAKYLMKCPVIRVMCKKCSMGSGDPGELGGVLSEKKDDEENMLSMNQNLHCECQYEVCKKCVNSDDSTIAVPKALMELGDEGMTPESSKSLLLPLLYYNNAILHRREKEMWCWSNVEIKTSKILQQIKKSKGRVVSSYSHNDMNLSEDVTTCSYLSTMGDRESLASVGPLLLENTFLHLPRTRTFHRPKTGFTTLPPTGDSEKFFLITLQQFVHQAHVLLEYVYVYLMSPEAVNKLPNVLPLVIKLESISKQINQLLCTLRFSSSSLLSKLQKLLDAGNKVVVAITKTFKSINVHGVSKQPTFFKTDFTKLPPIGQKVVQFADINEKTF